MKLGWSAALVLLAIVAGGCISSVTVLKISKDGSGTIEQTAYWADPENAQPPAGGPGEAKVTTREKKLDVEALKKQCADYAPKLGEGVTVKSVEPLKHDDGRNGAKVVYAFTDVSKVKLPFIPEIGQYKSSDDKPVTFQFARAGSGAKLTVNMPPMEQKNNAADDKPVDPQQEAMQDAMMQQLFKGTMAELHVRPEGGIARTNATHVSPDKTDVLLIKVDLDALSKDASAMKALKAIQKIKDPKQVKKTLATPPLSKYFQFDQNEDDKVEIELK